MFELPTGNRPIEGSCAEHPLILEGIKTEDMNDFLSVLYPLCVAVFLDLCALVLKIQRPPLSNAAGQKTDQQWMSVLRLASLWDFAEIKTKAITNLSAAGPCAKMQVYNLFPDALTSLKDEWIISSVRELVKRGEELTVYEAELIGVEKALKICVLRGEFLAFHTAGGACTKLDGKIKEKFGSELKSQTSFWAGTTNSKVATPLPPIQSTCQWLPPTRPAQTSTGFFNSLPNTCAHN